jgi:hypothetical protein
MKVNTGIRPGLCGEAVVVATGLPRTRWTFGPDVRRSLGAMARTPVVGTPAWLSAAAVGRAGHRMRYQ